jgi:hypothetical protein
MGAGSTGCGNQAMNIYILNILSVKMHYYFLHYHMVNMDTKNLLLNTIYNWSIGDQNRSIHQVAY